jgi:hypothetical protein
MGLTLVSKRSRAFGDLLSHVPVSEQTQNKSPGADKEANWLPAPKDTIYLVMRLYWPKTEAPSILPPGEGTWQPPGIKRVS